MWYSTLVQTTGDNGLDYECSVEHLFSCVAISSTPRQLSTDSFDYIGSLAMLYTSATMLVS